MNEKQDSKALAQKAFELGVTIDFKEVPRVRASLNQGEQLFANGAAKVSKDSVWFFPEFPINLDTVPSIGVNLKVLESGERIPLDFPKEYRGLSFERMLVFQPLA